MKALRFHVRDSQNARAKGDLETAFSELKFTQTDQLSACEILALHEGTDAPGKPMGIAQSNVDQLLDRGGIYIAYSTGKPEWDLSRGERKFFGSHTELIQRLSRLSGPVSIDHLRDALEKEKIVVKFLPALAILCQGYLAAHFLWPQSASANVKRALSMMGWTKFVETDEGQAFAKMVVKKKGMTVKPEWWQEIFGDIIKEEEQSPKSTFREKLDEEWGNMELPEEIAQLIDAILDQEPLKDTELVALAYLRLSERLKGAAS